MTKSKNFISVSIKRADYEWIMDNRGRGSASDKIHTLIENERNKNQHPAPQSTTSQPKELPIDIEIRKFEELLKKEPNNYGYKMILLGLTKKKANGATTP